MKSKLNTKACAGLLSVPWWLLFDVLWPPLCFFWLLLVIKVSATAYFLLCFSLLMIFYAFPHVGFLLVKHWPLLVEGCLTNYWINFICLISLADIQTLLFYKLRFNILLWCLRKGHWMLNQSLIIGNKPKLTLFFSVRLKTSIVFIYDQSCLLISLIHLYNMI